MIIEEEKIKHNEYLVEKEPCECRIDVYNRNKQPHLKSMKEDTH